ncbi:MAG: FtsW/RodA/SpoVE family cell cycle protein, partial [Lachnospiraceae bacterium]|nr:FtsW/RodA/SpoVE family cell cycle protein [Lachnospiraceae bacterium]
AVATNSIPNTGVSLPFVSFGGSSAIFTLMEIGLVMSVHRYNVLEAKEERA